MIWDFKNSSDIDAHLDIGPYLTDTVAAMVLIIFKGYGLFDFFCGLSYVLKADYSIILAGPQIPKLTS
jgi:hypothetical protein